ncbi:MAG: hypothetical protein Tsb0034_14520 [Ekhidna sp.]
MMAGCIGLAGCGKDEIQLPSQPLQGKVGGQEWRSELAGAFRISTNSFFQIRFLSDEEIVRDPCTLPAPGRPHVKAIFRPATGDFTVSPQAIDENQVLVAFEVSPSIILTASGGFMSIYDINNSVIFGYLEAILDDDNTVKGRFQIRLCN